jgi:hypothetical protein
MFCDLTLCFLNLTAGIVQVPVSGVPDALLMPFMMQEWGLRSPGMNGKPQMVRFFTRLIKHE